MKMHFTDLDELIELTKNTNAKTYLCESVEAYRAGAYRASIITIWIAVCTDIIEKIKEMGKSENKHAQGLVDIINKAVNDDKKRLDFENQLLGYACDSKNMQIISEHEKKQLQRLKEDRNACAHPSFEKNDEHFEPSSELARMHIVNACQYLLIHPATKGEKRIDDIMAKIKEDYFPLDQEKAYQLLKNSYHLDRESPTVQSNFLGKLLDKIFGLNGQESSKEMRPKLAICVYVVSKLNYHTSLKKTAQKKLNHIFTINPGKEIILRICFILKYDKDYFIWNNLEYEQQEELKRIIEEHTDITDLINFDIPKSIENYNPLVESLKNSINKMDKEDHWEIVKESPCLLFKDVVIDTFIKSENYNVAYQNGKVVVEYSSLLSSDDLKKVLSAHVENDQILPARNLDDIFMELYNKTNAKNKSPNYVEAWKEFVISLKHPYLLRNSYYSYSTLIKKLIDDGVISHDIVEEWEMDE